MNKSKILKISILITVLSVPALIIVFLHQFGDNKFEIPIMNPMSADCQSNTIDNVHRIPNFKFISQEGKAITEKDFEGKIYVVDFFFTRCPDICPVMTSELVRVQEAFKDYTDVKILSHSVDPVYDTVAILRDYAQKFNANPAIWTFVTGEKKDIYTMARCGYFISTKENSSPMKVDFIHSDKVVLIDKEKRIRGYYSGTNRKEIDRLITEIQILQKEYPK
jgi:protein SCO1/2